MHNSFSQLTHRVYDFCAMQRTHLTAELQGLLRTIQYGVLSTVSSQAQPSATPVVMYVGDDLRIYWASAATSQHSLNVAHNPQVGIVLFDSRAPLGTGVGLYMQARARALTTLAEVSAAMQIYADRYGEERCPAPFRLDCPRRIYCAEPVTIWRNADGAQNGHFIDTRHMLSGQA